MRPLAVPLAALVVLGPAAAPVSSVASSAGLPVAARTGTAEGWATGDWVAPVAPLVVLRGFDPPASDYGRGHRGVDLAAGAGAPVRAAGAGRVSHAALLAGRGVVVVRHDGGLRTTYEPVTALVVVGDLVAAGTPLGTLDGGHPSCAPRPCLHWGLRRDGPDGAYLDPLLLLRRGPSVLLPLQPGDAGVAGRP